MRGEAAPCPALMAIINHGKYVWPPPRGDLEMKWYVKPRIRVVCVLSHLAGHLADGDMGRAIQVATMGCDSAFSEHA